MGFRVLLVDDDPAILQTMAGIFRLEGLQVDTCCSAVAAINRLEQGEFELVITDMRMETPTAGCQVVRAAAEHPYHPRVVIVTAFPISASEVQGMGVAAVLLKGTNPGLLLERIRNLISEIQVGRAGVPVPALISRAAT